MADLADRAQDIIDEHLARGIAAARVPIPDGVPGVCAGCGDDSLRLIDDRCAPCRDGRMRL